MPAGADPAPPLRWGGGRGRGHPGQAAWGGRGLPDGILSLAEFNAAAAAARLAHLDGRRLSFVAALPSCPAIAYERRIAERGEIPLRAGDAHDAWNARAWLAFPRTKSALNAIHAAAGVAATANARGRERDAATLLDESGVIAACVDPTFVARWRARAWRAAFGIPAEALRQTLAVAVVGHGLLARLERPFPGLTAKALLLALDPATLPEGAAARRQALDAAAAARLADRGRGLAPADLLPLPLASVAEWDPAQRGDRRFDDRSVFRPR